MVSGDSTLVRDNQLKSHTPDLDPNFIKELLHSLKTSYKLIGGKNLNFPTHIMANLKALGPHNIVKHYKYHTSRFIAKFSLDTLEPPEGFNENLWFFNNKNKTYMKRRLLKFKYAFQFWQAKRGINAPLPKVVKEQDYLSFRQRLTQDQTIEYQFLENIANKAKHYFKDFKVPNPRMHVSTKACFGAHNVMEKIKTQYNIPTLKPYRTLRELSIHNLAAKYDYDQFEPHGTSVQLDEPLKIRTITKMHETQLLYKPVQEQLLHYIQKKSPEFILTKNPNEIWNAVQKSDILFDTNKKTGFYYCSGDYEAATDNLKRRVVMTVVEQIPGHELFIRQFGNSLIDDFICTNGQLMGNILSFPILCVINKFIYNVVQDMLPNSSSKPFINGDDILFSATLPFIQLWMKYTREAGFIPSKGKSLVDKHHFTINSRPFNNNGKIKFFNLKHTISKGLTPSEECEGLKKFITGGTGKEINEELVKKYIRFFPRFGKSKAFRIWRKFKSEYMPTEAGGLGLFPLNEEKLTNLQKMYSCWYLNGIREQPQTQLQREVGVRPFIAEETSTKNRIPRIKELIYPRNFQLRTMKTPELEKLRYGMLSSRTHESEGVCAFHQ